MAQYGLIEGGGTKFVLGIADEHGSIGARQRIATTTPDEVLPAAIAWFREVGLAPAAIGIASFGPLDLAPTSAGWGHVTRTVKPFWSGADLAGPFLREFACPVGLETDVGGAALAESRWGAGRGYASLLYLTVGTGIGGGFVQDGRLLVDCRTPKWAISGCRATPVTAHSPGSVHSMAIAGGAGERPRDQGALGDSLTGIAAGAGPDNPNADMIGWYLGQAICTFQAIMAPARIVLGGGVLDTPDCSPRSAGMRARPVVATSSAIRRTWSCYGIAP